MTAEEQLKELYRRQENVHNPKGVSFGHRKVPIVIGHEGICIAAEDIDLIANLVVERLRDSKIEG